MQERQPRSLVEQRDRVYREAKMLYRLGAEPSGPNYFAQEIARRGLWDEYAEHYKGDINKHILGRIEDDHKHYWVGYFAMGGNTEQIQFLINSTSDEAKRLELQKRAAIDLAVQGHLEAAYSLSENTDEGTLALVHNAAFYHLVQLEDYKQANKLLDGLTKPSSLFSVAEGVARKGHFEHFTTYIKQAIDMAGTTEDLGDMDQGSYLRRPIFTAATRAYMDGNFAFLQQLPTLLEWPESEKEDVKTWVEDGIVMGVVNSEDHEMGVAWFASRAVENGEDADAYISFQRAVQERNWDMIEIIARNINSETLGLALRIADQEGQQMSAKKLLDELQSRDLDTQNNFLLMADDAGSMCYQAAQRGDWDEVRELLGRVSGFFRGKLTEGLVNTAIEQEEYDILPVLIGGNDYYLSATADRLNTLGKFHEARTLLNEAAIHFSSEDEKLNFQYLALSMYGDQAAHAVGFGDWEMARDALMQGDRQVRKLRYRVGNSGYLEVAWSALETLAAIRRSREKTDWGE